jgi:hypothetical protein
VDAEDFFGLQDDTNLELDSLAAMVSVTLVHEVRVSSRMDGSHVDASYSGYMQIAPVHCLVLRMLRLLIRATKTRTGTALLGTCHTTKQSSTLTATVSKKALDVKSSCLTVTSLARYEVLVVAHAVCSHTFAAGTRLSGGYGYRAGTVEERK